MSRLDSVIRRLEAQRACLDRAVELVCDLPGPVFELGLGNGRTYDHLREICPAREVFVFDRAVSAHPDCIPDDDHIFLGDVRETLAAAVARFARAVPLVHSDVGTGDAERNARLAAFLATQLPLLLCPGGVVVSDQDIGWDGARALPLPEGVKPDRYFMYQAD